MSRKQQQEFSRYYESIQPKKRRGRPRKTGFNIHAFLKFPLSKIFRTKHYTGTFSEDGKQVTVRHNKSGRIQIFRKRGFKWIRVAIKRKRKS